jgi:tRNA pseudouridine32 synthase/23S rRNA pseudouridine746 synthase
MKPALVQSFKADVTGISIPATFTFPFHYEPHALARMAAAQLQNFITAQNWFAADNAQQDVGKMFGVLVVQDTAGNLGFIAAFSGKLVNSNLHSGFVPPLYDMLDEQGYFITESKKLEATNATISHLENSTTYHDTLFKVKRLGQEKSEKLEAQRLKVRHERAARKQLRVTQESILSNEEYANLQDQHNQRRINDRFLLREYEVYLDGKIAPFQKIINDVEQQIASLKEARRVKSSSVQDWLFERYNFLNARGHVKNVVAIFKEFSSIVPPAGAGDCAAPKLLQYAFQHQLKPIAMAEFWWGKPAPSNVRKQGNFYPACRNKCEPILGHMLQGLAVEPNPLLLNPAIGKELVFIYEDPYLVIVNKPAEFLSVPGKTITDSVQERMRSRYPNATGPLTVHRLDMATSGLMVIALSKEVHGHLQEQFMKRTVKKRYVALLDGIVKQSQEYIDLPLRVDIDNRPYQLVCYEHGKTARTRYEVLAVHNNQTRVNFYPITGRTHQLRMHAAHPNGLDTPIVGDDLYGVKKDRLYLHAAQLTFKHPVYKESMNFEIGAPF